MKTIFLGLIIMAMAFSMTACMDRGEEREQQRSEQKDDHDDRDDRDDREQNRDDD